MMVIANMLLQTYNEPCSVHVLEDVPTLHCICKSNYLKTSFIPSVKLV